MYNGLYTERNVGISATHTHSGPGGYNQYLLYSITSLGFVKESFDPLVDGIVEVIISVLSSDWDVLVPLPMHKKQQQQKQQND